MRHFFTQRVVSLGNSLPQKVVEAKTLDVFKRQLDIALEAKRIKGYGGEGGIRPLSWMISCDHYEWRSRLKGLNGLLLLLFSLFLYVSMRGCGDRVRGVGLG